MICVDANVLIEIILERRRANLCQKYIDETDQDLAITILTLDLVMYYAERHKLKLKPIEQFLRLFIWLPMTEADAELAFKSFGGQDFEDGLQLACAGREGCSRFLTLDNNLAKRRPKNILIDLIS